jgi:hypothetical protein
LIFRKLGRKKKRFQPISNVSIFLTFFWGRIIFSLKNEKL